MKRVAVYVYPLATLVGILAVWELASRLGEIPRYILPAPSGIAARFYALHALIVKESLFTLEATLLGFGLSVLIGVPLGMALVSSRAFNRAVYPLLIGSQVVPKVAVAPVFLVWFGFGLLSKVMITFLIAFFPILISAVVGLQSTELEKLYVARAAGASELQLFRLVRLPHALPSIFGGMKVSITLAVVGALVGEFVAAENGIGRVLLSASGNMDTELLFAGIFALVVIGVVLFLLMEVLERLVLPWHISYRPSKETL
ncbi:MAG TPA: ABC transporter permease [Burkholderiales bacterium]|nr:ABC transporter permease [Burkholderiales bacterium]